MSRAARIARLVSHRERQVDLAVKQLEQTRLRVRNAEVAVAAAEKAVVDARAAAHASTTKTAGELADLDAHVRALINRVARAKMQHESLRREEDQSRRQVVAARVELKKMESVLEAIERVREENEARAAQRAIDDRVGSNASRVA